MTDILRPLERELTLSIGSKARQETPEIFYNFLPSYQLLGHKIDELKFLS